MNKETEKIVQYCEEVINFNETYLSDGYYYQSLSLCVIDSIFSINANYTSTKNTVSRYCNYFEIQKYRTNKELIPDIKEQNSITDFINTIEKFGIEKFVNEVFKNKQRTSTKNGILKGEAVLRILKILQKRNVEYFQDVKKLYDDIDFENEVKLIPGQKSGISLKYFFMLSGSNNFIKPDRMIIRFLENLLSRKVSISEAENLLFDSSKVLKTKYSRVTPRILDHEIWKLSQVKR